MIADGIFPQFLHADELQHLDDSRRITLDSVR